VARLGRSRKPEREKALRLWIESGKKRRLKSIADELGVTDSQVRKWKKQDNWESFSKGTPVSENNTGVPFEKVRREQKNNVEKVRGGQKGNKNAKGHGAPAGNKNNFKHGIYENIYWSVLDDDEKQMIQAMSFDEEECLLVEQIQLLTVREHRLMKRIEEHTNTKGGLALERVTTRKLKEEIGNETGTQTETITQTISTTEIIGKIESELTKIQSRKTRCIEALNKLRINKKKFEDENKGSQVVNDWIEGLIGSDENG